ncbi:MAG TPA: 3-dehydroquinate synthase [Limnochordia bacterium]
MNADEAIVLIGCMGAGKSAVGRVVAERLGRPFIDTDAEIERRAGRSIPEIFASEGEAGFRAREREVIRWAAGQAGAVIASGGGAVCDQANWEAWRTAFVVWLRAPLAVLWERVRHDTGRPLLARSDPRAALAELCAQREPLYARADAVVQSDAELGAVAQAVIDAVRREPLWVELGARRYPIHIGPGELTRLGAHCRAVRPDGRPLGDRCLMITDAGVPPAWVDAAVDSLKAAGFRVGVTAIPSGEGAKRLETAGRLYDAAIEARLDRSSFVVAVGGGVVGDVAGFVAATYMRGIPWVQVPTTLLAQIDASVGGKVAVDHPRAKNLIGAFHQPCLVAVDVETLRTLPDRQLAAGWAELFKAGAIKDRALFARLEQLSSVRPPQREIVPAIRWACAIKAAVVAADETDRGERAILNFGHTIGHAIEAALGNDGARYLHGEAVAIGMVTEALLSEASGVCPPGVACRLSSALKRVGLPTGVEGVAPAAVIEAMDLDKKTVGGRWRFALLRAVGEAVLSDAVGVTIGRADVEGALARQARL